MVAVADIGQGATKRSFLNTDTNSTATTTALIVTSARQAM